MIDYPKTRQVMHKVILEIIITWSITLTQK